ncbi:MAG TPA: hypothetical protein VKS21_11165 [Spirochaetota bacterium]|nr:hypothetical protein [Spirochaetota bacterium]
MNSLLDQIKNLLQPEEIIGISGGILFFISWIVQAAESRRAGKPVVSFRFFLIRMIACIILLAESIRVASLGLSLVYTGTLLLIFYNFFIMWRRKQ